MIRTLLVDDERLARVRLRSLLEAHPDVVVVGEAADVDEARVFLAAHDVDLLFLDVRLPGGDGFAVLDSFAGAVIFVTAFPQHAARAFDVAAVDYLVKPVPPARLAVALGRISHRPTVFVVRHGTTAEMVRADAIARIAGADDYSELHLADGRSLLSEVRLAAWEARLGRELVRLHRSHLVRVDRIASLRRAGERCHEVVLRDGTVVPVARRRLPILRSALARSGQHDHHGPG